MKILQAEEYRVAIDSVLLAEFVATHYYGETQPVNKRTNKLIGNLDIAELGVGTGGVMLCLLHYLQATWHAMSRIMVTSAKNIF